MKFWVCLSFIGQFFVGSVSALQVRFGSIQALQVIFVFASVSALQDNVWSVCLSTARQFFFGGGASKPCRSVFESV